MKKIVFLLMLTLSISAYSLEAYVRVGGIANSNEVNGDSAYSDFAPTFGLEVQQSFAIFSVGAGVGYNGETTDISTVPAYLLAKWNILPLSPITPYLVGKYGKIISTGDDISGVDPDGDNYYAIGVGADIGPFEGELLYSITELDDNDGGSDNLDQLSLVFAYRFFDFF